MELGELLIQYREQNNLSQREFARKCGLSHALISLIELNKRKSTPDTETYKKLATGMGMTVQNLFLQLGDSAMVNLQVDRPIIINDSKLFRKLLLAMSPADYQTMMEIFERTERKLKEKGEL